MRLHEDIDFTTLTWVKPELDETLRQARQALEAYVEDGQEPGQLKACATYLHQVQGTLRMVELYGAAMVAEEMEQLARALVDGKVADRDAGYAALMRGIVQLPDYLERLQSGHRDIPIVLLPLLNELREPRGEKGLSEAVLFSPDLSRPLPASAAGPAEPLAAEQLKRRAETLRGLFQSALLRWLKDDNSAATIRDLTDVCEQLVPITDSEHARRLFWVAAGTLDALAKNAFEATRPLKQALAKVEQEIKRLAEGGDAAFRSDPPLELTRQLLYFVAHAPTDHGRIGEIRQVFGLGEYMPSESELAHARGSLSGRNRALLSTVAGAIKEDLMRVKDALDLHLRTPEAPSAALSDQVEALDRVADTLGMLGLGVPRRVVQDQRNTIQAIVGGQRPADESALLDIAGALLYVEASLDDQVARLGEADADAEGPIDDSLLAGAEARKVLEVVIKEAIGNFAQARQCFVAFVETHWDHAQLRDVPRLMEEVGGALRILELPDAPAYLTAVRRFTETELLRRRRVPNGHQMDRLADVLASLEYYLEAVRDRSARREQFLDKAKQNLESLGYWPLPPEEQLTAETVPVAAPRASEPVAAAPVAPAEVAPVAAAPVAEAPVGTDVATPVFEPADTASPISAADLAAADALASGGIALEPDTSALDAAFAIPSGDFASTDASASGTAAFDPAETGAEAATRDETAPAEAMAPAPQHPVIPGFDGSSDEIDDEIREVFLEEFEEEIGNLEQLLPAWRRAPADNELLRPIRRVFHTLKGSGRLVGAKALGEFSWKVESMLNRVLDGTRPASPAVIGVIERAFDTLPSLRAALAGETVHADLAGIEQVADRVAAGEEAFYAPPAAPAAPVAVVSAPEPEPVVETGPVAEATPEPSAAEFEASISETGFVIDPVLFEILKPEVAGHLETVDAWLAECAARGPQPISDPLLRAVHTMNGAFAMTEVTVLTDVTAPLEGFMKRSIAAHRVPGAEGVSLVAGAAAAIREAIVALERPNPVMPVFTELAERAEAARDRLPEAATGFAPVHHDEAEMLPTPVPMEPPMIAGLPSFDAEATQGAAVDQEHISLDAFLVEAPGSDAAPALSITEHGIDLGDGESAGAAFDAPLTLDGAADADDAAGADFIASDAEAEAADAERAAAEVAAAEAAAAAIALAEAERAEALRAEAERVELERAEAERVEAERVEAERAEAERVETERVEAERAEAERVEAERAEAERVEAERVEAQRAEAERADAERAEAERVEAERVEAERVEAERIEAERVEAERIEAERIEAERVEAERAEAERAEAERAEAERAEAERAEAERAEAERAEAERVEAERIEAERVEAERAEIARLDAERDAEAAARLLADAEAFAGDAFAVDADGVEATADPAIAADDFYGLSIEELEALTAPAEPAGPATPRPTDEPATDPVVIEPEVVEPAVIEPDVVVPEVVEPEVVEPEAAASDAVASADEASLVFDEVAPEESALFEPASIENVVVDELEEAQAATQEAALDFDHATVAAAADADADADAGDFSLPVAETPDATIGQEPVAEADAAESVPVAIDPEDPDAALDTTDLDVDLLDIFLEESGDLLDHSDGLLARLRDNTTDRELVVGLQRDLHTLKGGARMAGIYAVGELGHAMESLLEVVAEGRRELDQTGVVVLERAFDRLHGMVTRVGERKAIALPANLIGQIDSLARGRPLETAPAVATEKPAERVAPVETALDRAAAAAEEAVGVRIAPVARPAAASGVEMAPLSAPIEGLGEDGDAGGVAAPQEQVRIRADLLDRLVNYAGEVAIYRARLEQQLGAFRANLGELGQTTTRLREQLRKLDIETEAQIIARYQREGATDDESFDPLELDRFTTQQQLSRSLAESAADLTSLQISLDDLVRQYETLLLQQSRVSSELQEGLMRTRMVPFDALVPRLRRVLRQSGGETGKSVNLKVDGASGEMDRNVLDRMTAPLEHMLRNAVAHGLEAPADRKKAKKPEEGTVRIQVLREGSEVVLMVSDDGRGLDKEAIRRKAIERGLLKADAEVSDQTLYGYILETGFSTAQSVSRLAGRGVGMDVVYSEIRQLGGSLSIDSEHGKGSTFTIRLPFTLAVTQAVFVKIGETSFAVPIASVQGVGRMSRADLDRQLASENPTFMYAGEAYAIHDLGRLIGHAPAKAQDSLQMPLLLARAGDLRAAITIDQVLGSREIVVKPVGPQVNSIPGIFGATIMGDGRVVVILDVAPLVRRQAAIDRSAEAATPAPAAVVQRVPVVMVVDDSITMRKVTGRVLERHGMEVMTAKDGVDAIEKMAERIPDLMLLDIEMPRMDGYELAQNMKSDARMKDVPIIMITSRTGEKHRQRAFDIGVNRYLGKPYQEVELMRNVFEMLGVEAAHA